MTEQLVELGVIGLSPGNGHPYSWSAIINGFDEARIQDCPFPVIIEYLSQQKWPNARIRGAHVSHVHAPDKEVAHSIARAAFVPNVSSLDELSEAVDAVLLARDDAENHAHYARQALQAGKPVYVDKPIALSRRRLDEILALQAVQGQIFTCSALSFSPDFEPLTSLPLDAVQSVTSQAPKDWKRYGMHAIEPVVSSVWHRIQGQRWAAEASRQAGVTHLLVRYEDGLELQFKCTGNAGSEFRIEAFFHAEPPLVLVHRDTFTAFRSALQLFIKGVRAGHSFANIDMVTHCVDLLQAGLQSE